MSWAGPIINDTGGMGGLTVLHQTATSTHLQSVTRSAQRCSCDPRYRHSRHGRVSCVYWPGSCQPRQGRKAFSLRVQPPPGQSSSITRYQSRHKRCHGDLRHSHAQREPLGFFVAGVDLRWRLVGACTVGSTPNPRPSCSCNKNVSVPSSPGAGHSATTSFACTNTRMPVFLLSVCLAEPPFAGRSIYFCSHTAHHWATPLT